MNDIEYDEPNSYNKQEIQSIIKSNDASLISKMLVGVAFNEKNVEYAYSIIYDYLSDGRPEIVGLSIICLAHLARIHEHIPTKKTVFALKKIIESTNGNNEIIRSRMGDAVGDFSIYQPEIYEHLFNEFKEYIESLGF